MDMPGYPPGHSLKTKLAAHEPSISSPSLFRRIQCLSLFLSPEEIVELSHQFRSYPDEVLHHLATSARRESLSLSESQRSSYLSNFSRQSMLSSSSLYSRDSASTDNCTIDQPKLEIERQWQQSYPASQPGAQETSLSNSLPPPGQVLYNQDASHSAYAPPARKPFCFACNEQFKNKGSLTRHQKEQCEREQISACSLCPPPQPMYYTKERLLRHHVASHGDKCPNGCSKKEKKISMPCKDHLSKSFEELPVKKAWGCPYCVSCLKTFDEWQEHCANHLGKADKAPTWCFGTMLWSLLQQDGLRDARMRHDVPETNNWSTVNEKTCPGLREILEHCKLPIALRSREDYGLSACDAVVRCVFDYIGRGETLPSQQLFEAKAKQIPGTTLSSAVELARGLSSASEPFLPQGNANEAVKALLYSHDRADDAYMNPRLGGRKAGGASQPHFSSSCDTAAVVRSRRAEVPDADETANTQPRKRAPSLKRSVSNLALRPSPSRSPAVQTVDVPPVPPGPGDTKVLNTDKAGAGIHHDGGWLTPAYLDPIPHHRPMSGVVYDQWSWSDGNQGQQ